MGQPLSAALAHRSHALPRLTAVRYWEHTGRS